MTIAEMLVAGLVTGLGLWSSWLIVASTDRTRNGSVERRLDGEAREEDLR
jgi:hypothetical protein